MRATAASCTFETSGTADGAAPRRAAPAADGSAVVFGAAGGRTCRAATGRGAGGLPARGAPSDTQHLAGPGGPRAHERRRVGAHVGVPHSVSADGRFVPPCAGGGAGVRQPARRRPPPTRASPAKGWSATLVCGQTTLASVAHRRHAGRAATAGARSIDAAGDRVLFVSQATQPGRRCHALGSNHGYLRDPAAGTTTLVDRTAAGAADPGRLRGRISGDGRHVVYATRSRRARGASDRHATSTCTSSISGPGRRRSPTAPRAPTVRWRTRSSSGLISTATGRRLAFVGAATNLGAGDPGGKRQVVCPRRRCEDDDVGVDARGRHRRTRTRTPGGQPRRTSASPSRSPDPQFGNGMTGTVVIFTRDLTTGTTQLVSADTGLTDPQAFAPADQRRRHARDVHRPAARQSARPRRCTCATCRRERRRSSPPRATARPRAGSAPSAAPSAATARASRWAPPPMTSSARATDPTSATCVERCVAAPAGGGGGDGGGVASAAAAAVAVAAAVAAAAVAVAAVAARLRRTARRRPSPRRPSRTAASASPRAAPQSRRRRPRAAPRSSSSCPRRRARRSRSRSGSTVSRKGAKCVAPRRGLTRKCTRIVDGAHPEPRRDACGHEPRRVHRSHDEGDPEARGLRGAADRARPGGQPLPRREGQLPRREAITRDRARRRGPHGPRRRACGSTRRDASRRS